MHARQHLLSLNPLLVMLMTPFLLARWRRRADAGHVQPAASKMAAGALIVAPHALWMAASAAGRPLGSVGAVKYGVLALVLGSMAVSAMNLRAGYRVADAEGRRRVFWVLEGFLLATAIAVLASALKLLGLGTAPTGIVLLASLLVAPTVWMVVRRANGFPALARSQRQANARAASDLENNPQTASR